MENEVNTAQKQTKSPPPEVRVTKKLPPAEGTILVRARDEHGVHAPIPGAEVRIIAKDRQEMSHHCYTPGLTDINGTYTSHVPVGPHLIECQAFGEVLCDDVDIKEGEAQEEIVFEFPVDLKVIFRVHRPDLTYVECTEVPAGSTFIARADHRPLKKVSRYIWTVSGCDILEPEPDRGNQEIHLSASQNTKAQVFVTMRGSASQSALATLLVTPQAIQPISGNISVNLRRTATTATNDLPLWVIIRRATEAVAFDNYQRFMDLLVCGTPRNVPLTQAEQTQDALRLRRFLPFNDTDTYRLLKVATEAFLMVNCGVFLETPLFTQEELDNLLGNLSLTGNLDLPGLNTLWGRYLEFINGTSGPQTIPYLELVRRKLPEVTFIPNPQPAGLVDCIGVFAEKLTRPCLVELLWSYWQEEGMLVQTLNAISRRFQNVRSLVGGRDPLAGVELDPLRTINPVMWGYIQDEQHRLTVLRRAYEYDHHYGLSLYGKAVPDIQAADSRSKFLEAFHNLLNVSSTFYKRDDNTTVIADGFPVLNALKEVHLLLSEGAHNQFGDLPSTARQEMLIQQWILARPEFREFLPTRIMVAYPEPWMDRVDAMKTIQGWTDTSVLHFRNLAVFGEQVLLSIRYGAWSTINDASAAANWARFWRAEVQGYSHAYRAVTGVDLTSETTATSLQEQRAIQPSVHLRKRLSAQQPKS